MAKSPFFSTAVFVFLADSLLGIINKRAISFYYNAYQVSIICTNCQLLLMQLLKFHIRTDLCSLSRCNSFALF